VGVGLSLAAGLYKAVKDSRMVSILLKAAKYDRITGTRPKQVVPVVKNNQKTAKPGVGSKRTAPKVNQRAMDRLSRTGSLEDAASVFTSIINRS
jgi:hypothetical protein